MPDHPFPLMASRPIQGHQLSPFRELYGQGVRLFFIDATFSEDIFHPELRAWTAPGQFDYSYQENYWKELLAACPEAKLCLRCYAASPPWWDEAHPDELQAYADGTREAEFQRTNRRTLPSLASDAWSADAARALRNFLAWLDESGWSEKIWGIVLCYGITWEWGILGTDRFPDYSAPMQKAFRRWLAHEYGTEEKLRQAWGRAEVTFATVEIPTLAERQRGDGDFRSFPRDRAACDFQNCLSDLNADYLLLLGQTVRAHAGKRYVVGSIYGYTLTAREQTPFTGRYGAGGLAGGHHAYGRVLRSGLFDFNASPYAYVDRELGHGVLIPHYPYSSCTHHGVHCYQENDLRTFLVAGQFDDRVISIGQTDTREDSIQHQRWALAQALARNEGMWWMELSDWIGPYQPYYDDPALLKEMRKLIDLFKTHAGKLGGARSEIALVIDERAIAALALDSKLFLREVYQQLPKWGWTGAPYDVWLASDLSGDMLSPYRLVYYFGPFLDQAQATATRALLEKEGRTVLWAPGTGALAGLNLPAFACAGKSAAELRQIAERAGVFLYTDRPAHVIAADQGLFVHVNEAGTYTIRHPHLTAMTDLFSGQKIQSGASVKLAAKQVCLWVNERA